MDVRTHLAKRFDRIFLMNFLIWPTLGSLIASAMYSTKITVDGYFYLSSSRALFSNQMETHYFWIRDPGYPLFLRIIQATFGNADVWIICVQAFLLIIPISLLCRIAFAGQSRMNAIVTPLLLLFAILTPQYMGYSAIILKQPLIVFLIGFMPILPWLALRLRRLRHFPIFSVCLFVINFLAISLTITTTYVVFFLTPLLIFALVWRPDLCFTRQASRELLIRAVIALVATALPISLSSAIFNSWWNGVRDAHSTDSSTELVVGGNQLGRWFDSPFDSIEDSVHDARALLMLGPTDNANGVQENQLYTSIQAHPTWRCGAADSFESEPYTTFGRQAVSFTCRSQVMHSLTSIFHRSGSIAYQTMNGIGVIAVVALIIRRRFRLLMLVSPVLLFAGLYSFGNVFVVDRYGLPVFPFSLVLTSFVVISAFRRWPHQIRPLTSRA
jgi:hypothetical protein